MTREFDVFDMLKTAVTLAEISHGARNLLALLVMFAGPKRKTWYSNESLSEMMNESVEQIRSWKAELIGKGLLDETFQGWRTTMWPFPGR